MKQQKKKVSMVQTIVVINLISLVFLGLCLAITSGIMVASRTNKDYVSIARTASTHVYSWMEEMGDGDYTYDEATGKFYKGDKEITDAAFQFIHKDNANMQHTIFWGETRIISDITDDEGNSVVGSTLSDPTIYETVKSAGYYAKNNVEIYGDQYSVCYFPIKNGDEVVGMVFTGVNQTSSNKAILKDIIIMTVITIVLALILILIVIKVLNNRAKIFGGHLMEASGIAKDKEASVSDLGQQTYENMRQINTAIEQVTMAVTTQASHTEEIMGSMEEFGDNLDTIVNRVNATSDVASSGIEQIEEMTTQLHQLETVSGENNIEINNISKQIEDDIEAVNDIRKIVDVINDIAFQITILSFNASVEAARAGEAGKGFAVVADSIKDLSDKTKTSLEEITQIIEDIAEKMNETGDASENLIKKNQTLVDALSATKERMTSVTQSFDKISDNIGEIKEGSIAIIEGKNQVVETVSSLAAASQENAAMSEEIKATADEVVGANQSLMEEISRLQEITRILQDVRIFFDNNRSEQGNKTKA